MLGKELTSQVLDDYKTAPISDKLRAMLGVIETVTRDPAALTVEDVRRLRALGISRQAIVDALYVTYCFNIYTRLADAMGWRVPTQVEFDKSAQILLKRGYL